MCSTSSQSFEEVRNVEISQVVDMRRPSAVSSVARSGAQVNDGMDEGRPWYFRHRMPIRPLQGLPVANSDIELGSRLPPIP